ncbi:hypothetical protein NKI91_09225 [Mesorhizobium sp. M0312]|uniref:hypothetical protein n=1 Tax=Mesorhizobium sp. M0312 TaxID=2956934 RepID=UPI0033379B9B
MSKLRFLRSVALEELRNGIAQNLAAYRMGDFSEICYDPAYWFEHSVEFDETRMTALMRQPMANTSKSKTAASSMVHSRG